MNYNHDIKDYVLEVGQKGKYRLELLDKIYGITTRTNFLNMKLASTSTILSLGCGIGTVESWLAQEIVPNGFLTAIDNSKKQIEIASEKTKSLGINNIQFITNDAASIDFDSEFDVIYSRFLLMHINSPNILIDKMIKALKSGGILISEESINSWTNSYPQNYYVSKMRDLTTNIGIKRGLDYDIGLKTPSLFYERGLKGIKSSITLPSYLTGTEKELMKLSIIEGKNNYLSEGLISEVEFEESIKYLEEFNLNRSNLMIFAPMSQVTCIKN